MGDRHSNSSESSSEEDDDEDKKFTGQWDKNCRELADDMRIKRAQVDQFACETIQELLKKNSKYMGATAPSGKQLIHWAAIGGCPLTIQLLLSRGAQKDSTDIWRKTPRDYAVEAGHSDAIVNLLT